MPREYVKASCFCKNIKKSVYRDNPRVALSFATLSKSGALFPSADGEVSVYLRLKEFLAFSEMLSTKAYCEFFGNDNLDNAELNSLKDMSYVAAGELYCDKVEELAKTVNAISRIDFNLIYFSLSRIHALLEKDKSGTYSKSDIKTKRRYIDEVLALALKQGISEEQAAEKLLKSGLKNIREGKSLKVRYLYFLSLILITLSLSAVSAFLSGSGYLFILFFILFSVPSYELSKQILNGVFSFSGGNALPRLDRECVREIGCLTVIVTMLTDEKHIGGIMERLEDFYLKNSGEKRYFAVLGDYGEYNKKYRSDDKRLREYAVTRINALNAKYGGCFMLFVRERSLLSGEGRYMGWERKRGAVLELCRFLKGQDTSFRTFTGKKEVLNGIKYILTLDSDTNLYSGAVDDLVGTAYHPSNRVGYNADKTCVISGHGIIQPKMTTALSSFNKTSFSRMTGGDAGTDAYSGTSFDLYQDVFSRGSFCGKGIIDIDAYLTVCDGAFPENRILSHDLLEGELLRAGYAKDIILSDGTPKSAKSFYKRQERWIRGDLQSLIFLGKRIASRYNNLTFLSKYKLCDNVIRHSAPLFSFLVIVSALAARVNVLPPLLLSVSYLLYPLIISPVFGIIFGDIRYAARRLTTDIFHIVAGYGKYALYKLSAIVYESCIFVSAVMKTVVRFCITKRGFLDWTTFSESEKSSAFTVDRFYIITFVAGILFGMSYSVVIKLLALLWAIFPVWMLISSYEYKNARLKFTDNERLLSYARDMWGYFYDNVNESTNFLPPDNVQLSPVERTAMRTSPTDIIMYMLSVLCARDLNFINSEELRVTLENTLGTVSGLSKWNGNLYNWYDISKLSVIGGAFVSSVDSGNFVSGCVALSEGLKEYVREEPGLLNCIASLNDIISKTDLKSLFDEDRNLFYIGYDSLNSRYTDSRYDMLMSEAKLLSYYACASKQVPESHYYALSRSVTVKRGRIYALSWSGTVFEYYMPLLLLNAPGDFLTDKTLSCVYNSQIRARKTIRQNGAVKSVFGISESGYFAFDADMNYQYSAFGISELSRNPELVTQKVISPYSSFLMMEYDYNGIMNNLSALKALGAYGKYGFYEAVDFGKNRVGNGYAIIKSFMSHHVGMSMVSCVNAINGGTFRKRFMKNPLMRASGELLEEKIPSVTCESAQCVNVGSERIKKAEKEKAAVRVRAQKEKKESEYNLFSPDVCCISNNKSRIVCSSSGHVALYDGDRIVTGDADTFSIYDLRDGLRIYAYADGHVLSCVPLGYKEADDEAEYAFYEKSGYIMYSSRHEINGKSYSFDVKLYVYPDSSAFRIEFNVGGCEGTSRVMLYFIPMYEYAHKRVSNRIFSDLFIESEYLKKENILLIKRRRESGGNTKSYIGVSYVSKNKIKALYCTSGYHADRPSHEERIAKLAEKIPPVYSGASPSPICDMTLEGSGRLSGAFLISVSDNLEDVLYCSDNGRKTSFSKAEREKINNLHALQHGLSGTDDTYTELKKTILRKLYFPDSGARDKKTEVEFISNPLRQSDLWKYGISGDIPIICALYSDTSDTAEQCIRVFKYLRILGIAFDMAVLYSDSDGYRDEKRQLIIKTCEYYGVSGFVGAREGIHVVKVNDIDRINNSVIARYSRCVIGENIEEHPNISVSNDAMTRYAPRMSGDTSALPKVNIIEHVSGGYFTENGFLSVKSSREIPWAYIISSRNFGTVISENSLGYTFFLNSALFKLTAHTADAIKEDTGERLFLRVYDTFDKSHFSTYDMCASSGYFHISGACAEYKGKVRELEYTVRVTVERKLPIKIISVGVKNVSGRETLYSVSMLCAPCLGQNSGDEAGYVYSADTTSCRAIVHRVTGNVLSGGMALFSEYKCDKMIFDRAEFLSDGALCSGRNDCMCLTAKYKRSSYQTFYLSYFKTEETLRYVTENRDSFSAVRAPEVSVSVKTESPVIDLSLNKFFPYQTVISRLYARSGYSQTGGAYGFRDQLQDITSLLAEAPDTAKIHILRCCAHQYDDGSVMHWWHNLTGRGIKSRCSDDMLWLVFAVCEYVDFTGDREILDIKTRFLVSEPLNTHESDRYEKASKTDEKYSVSEHCVRAIEYSLKTGSHGLPLFGAGDWNDGMNRVGIGGKGESVWLGQFIPYIVFRCVKSGIIPDGKARIFVSESLSLIKAVKDSGYNGEHYTRGYYDSGKTLGTGNGYMLDALTQLQATFLNDAAGEKLLEDASALRLMYERLFDGKNMLFALLSPPFDGEKENPGYISGYLPGIRENGGQYTHAAVWAARALLLDGQIERGTEILLAVNTSLRYLKPDIAKAYKKEPYAMAGDVYTNSDLYGLGGWSFYTGAAGWYRKVFIEDLCGLSVKGDYFTLSPRLSRLFSFFTLTIKIKETEYTLNVKSSNADTAVIDGETLISEGSEMRLHRFYFDKGVHTVAFYLKI